MNTELQRLRVFIARNTKLNLREAAELICSGRVTVNGINAKPSLLVGESDIIMLDGDRVEFVKPVYILFYKPRGIECTLNPAIPDNLLTVFKYSQRMFPVGRLDKESEGLLLMTNDGSVYHGVAHAESNKEKEYVVTVHKATDEDFFRQMCDGMEILGKHTGVSKVFPIENDPFSFRIILTKGMNRQIRRMCYKLGYSVHRLERTRIVHLTSAGMKPGEMRELTSAEVEELRSVAK